jgi:magnesium transporter
VSGLLDTQANEQGNDLNDIAKKPASWAAVIAAPTLITGFYGQNFPFPGIGNYAGTISSILAMPSSPSASTSCWETPLDLMAR